MVVDTKDSKEVIAPYVGHLSTDIVSDPDGIVARSMAITQFPQVSHLSNGLVVWSKPPKVGVADASVQHVGELGFKGIPGDVNKSVEDEVKLLGKYIEAQGCKK